MTINISTLPFKAPRNPTNCPIMSPINSRNVRRGMCGHAKLPTNFQIKKPSKRATRSSIKRPSKCPTMSPNKASSKSLTRAQTRAQATAQPRDQARVHPTHTKTHQEHTNDTSRAHQTHTKTVTSRIAQSAAQKVYQLQIIRQDTFSTFSTLARTFRHMSQQTWCALFQHSSIIGPRRCNIQSVLVGLFAGDLVGEIIHHEK